MRNQQNADPKHIHLVANTKSIMLVKIELPLFREWAERFQAKEATYTWQPLTHYTATGQIPPTFDEQLEEAEAVERRWRKEACWKMTAEGVEPARYEQAYREVYFIFHGYTSPTSALLATYQAKLREAGYSEASINALEVMPTPQQAEFEE